MCFLCVVNLTELNLTQKSIFVSLQSLGKMDKLIITSYADMIAWPRNAIHEGASNEHAKAQLKKVCHILGQYGQ